MAEYGKQFFDQCLAAIAGELESLEEEHPDCSDDPVQAAALVAKKAGKLLAASINLDCENADDRNLILKEAIQTGAMALKFMLTMNSGLRYEMEKVRW